MKKFSETAAVLFAGAALVIGAVGFLPHSAGAADDVSGILMAGTAEISNSSTNTYDWSVSSYEGITAVQPGNSGVKSSSSTLNVDVSGTGVLAFGCYVSSEATYDKLVVSLDGTAVHTLSGVQEWQKLTVPVDTDGSHTITFAYSKDSSVNGNDDTCYIGDLSFCEYADESDFTFNSSTGSITAYNGSAETVVIPSSIDGTAVKTLSNTFSGNSTITGAIISSGITSIDTKAFYNCNVLKSITLPDSIITIGEYAFYNCYSLVNLVISDSATILDKYSFYKCAGLVSITIPNSVTSIGVDAFYSCTGLTSITLPAGLTNLGSNVFGECSKLEIINLSSDNTAYVFDDGGLYNSSKTELIYVPPCSGIEIFNIPSGVTTVDNYAFNYCSTLTSITIPNSVISIGSYAFEYCSSLTSITIPDSVTSLGTGAFLCCSNLSNISLSAGLTKISEYLFEYCTSLKNIQIPTGVTSINNFAFWRCSALTEIVIPSSVTAVKFGVFNGCTKLKNALIPSSVTSIEWNSFIGLTSASIYCTKGSAADDSELYGSLCQIIYLSDESDFTFDASTGTITGYLGSDEDIIIPNTIDGITVTAIDKNVFKDNSKIISITMFYGITSVGSMAFYNCSSLESITIPDSVTTIDSMAFYNCSSLLNITIPDNVTSIGTYTFYNCSSLSSITIPDSVTTIGSSAFWYCTGLTSVIIPENVTTIKSYAFGDCSSLKSITIFPSMATISSYAFINVTNATIYCYIDSTADNTSLYDSSCNIVYLYNEGDFTFESSTGTITGYTGNGGSVVIPDSIDGVTVTTIGYNAFYGKTAVTYIYVPSSITTIEDQAFYNCSGLTEIYLSDSLTEIGQYAFANCSCLAEIDIPNNVTTIGSHAFMSCTSLLNVTIPESVTSLGSYVFRKCNGLTAINVDSNNISYKSEDGVLFNKDGTTLMLCPTGSGIENYAVPTGVTTISQYAFYEMTGLISITIPGSVKNLSKYSFSGSNSFTVYCSKNSAADNISLYPEGSTIIYTSVTVTYDYGTNGGDSADMESMSLDESAEADLSVEAYKDGWEFIGWNVDPEAESGLEGYTAESDVTLYAIYRKEIAANLYSGDCELQETVIGTLYNNDTSAEITLPEVGAYSDYEALGWRDDTSVSTAEFSPGSTASISEDTDFYAVYKRTLTLSYNANGGTTAPEAQTAVQYYSASGSLQRKTFTLADEIERSGYSFAGWAAGGTSGKTYSAGASISVSDDTTMYALWTATTAQTLPEISASAASSITASSAVLNGVVENDGGSDIINRKFIYYEKNNSGAVYEVEADSSFSAAISNLKPNTEYWFYASANNLIGYGNSVYKSFTTLADGEEVPVSLEISPSAVTVRTGAAVALATKVLPTTAANKNIVWTSSDEAVAEVDADGNITGISEGQAVITATTEVGRLKAAATVTVTDADVEIDLSEWNMYSNTRSGTTLNYSASFTQGGSITFSSAYLADWIGPVYESDDTYPTTGGSTSFSRLEPRYHTQNILYIPKRTSDTDNDNIKNAVMTYGGVATSMYYYADYLKGASYYMPSDSTKTSGTGHQVLIVGWDDNYDKSNFNRTPDGNGAFICKNSYGSDHGEDGYFYVSYYDKGIGRKSGITNAVFLTAESVNNYNKKYEYDPLGPVTSFGPEGYDTFYAANVFPENGSSLSCDEELSAVSFYTYSMGTAYDIYVVTDYKSKASLPGLSAPVASGTQEYAGYHTVEFDPIELESGTRFAVVVKLSKPDTQIYTYIECPGSSIYKSASANADESYYSTDGGIWNDLTDSVSGSSYDYSNANFCIKAFVNSSEETAQLNSQSNALLALLSGEALTSEESSDVETSNTGELESSIEIDDADIDYLDGTSFPDRYDLRDYGYVTSVKDQGSYETCWAFAAIGSMESTTARKMLTALDGSSSDLDGASEDALLSDISVESVSIDKGSIVIAPGAAMQLTYAISPSNASNTAVMWSSSNDNVVSVDTGGNITAKKTGTASITIKTADGGKTAQCSVTVLSGEEVTGVSYDKTEISCKIGKVMLLDYTVSPGNASDKTVSWASSNPDVVSVNENGLVTALTAGEAVITVITEDGGYEDYCTVTVNDNFSLKISEASNTLKQYGSYVFGSITLNIDNNGEALSEAVVITAIYDEEGKLVEYITDDAALGQGSNSITISDIVFENSSSSLNYKIMLWDSEENMIPLAAAVSGEF